MSFVFFIINYTTSYTYPKVHVCASAYTVCMQLKKIHSILFCHFSLPIFDLTDPSLWSFGFVFF